LVERLNGIEEVRGSNPLGSKSFYARDLQSKEGCSNKPTNNISREFRARLGSFDVWAILL
jgi:hypothetical protein